MEKMEVDKPDSNPAVGSSTGDGSGLRADMTMCEYWTSRYGQCSNSNLAKLVSGDSMSMEQLDTAINTMVLVDALILTIPFSLFLDLGQEYWNNLQANINACSDYSTGYQAAFSRTRGAMGTMVYSTMIGIVVTALYYLMRPDYKGVSFKVWWKYAGGYVFMMILFSTIAAIVSSLIMSSMIFRYSFVDSDDFCDNPNYNDYTGGYAAVSIAAFVALLLLM
mmetsp:Transcript_939/g.1470  ORF Transcript_939/g.1470 Transcript_939/m.1470 type:complete len:221 (+) Transcript_939:33-695(+)